MINDTAASHATLLPPLAADFAASRDDLQRVAVHILARRRANATGRIGLRPAPGGIATPAFGPGLEAVRTSGAHLVHEREGKVRVVPLTTLADAAKLLDLDLDAPFSVGHDTPPAGDVHVPLRLHAPSLDVMATWYGLVQAALDATVAGLPASAAPTSAQLWPEHFDLACDVGWGAAAGERANLGGSPGDGFHPAPYAYVGPWGAERPGDPAFWNAPFGAVLPWDAVVGRDVAAAVEHVARFFREGLALLTA